MRWIKWMGLIAAVLLVIACFMNWVFISSKSITISGIDTTGTNFGKPAYIHFIMSGLFIVFTIVQTVIAKRINLLVTAVNLGWAIRNYFIVSLCRGGECPEKQWGVYLVVISSVLMLVSAMFPDTTIKEKAPASTV